MNANIQNYRGLASASLDISRIALLAGPNEAGKTSTVQALAAALTGDPVPIAGVKKAQAGLLVRSGTANGSVTLTGPNGETVITWPAAKVKTEGQAPFASHFAAGMQSIVTMEDKERVKILTEYLKATPTRADLDSQLAGMNLAPAVLDQLWKLIETQGWDNAHAQIKEKGARLKGQWEAVTGDRYGSKKADSWIPEGYEPGMEGASEDNLKACVTDARDALEASIAANAVDDSERQRLGELAAQIPERQAAVDAANAVEVDSTEADGLKLQLDEGRKLLADIQKVIDEKKAALSGLQQPAAQKSHPHDRMFCPECKTMLFVSEFKTLKKVEEQQPALPVDNSAEVAELQEQITRAEGIYKTDSATVEDINKRYIAAKDALVSAHSKRAREIGQAEEALKAATAAQTKLAEMAATPAQPTNTVDECRTALALAELRLKAFTKKTEADRLHISIGQNAELMAKIAPEGIRGDVLTRALKGFNTSLEKFCTAAGWRPVTLEADFMPTYGGTIYLLLSESAKFRVRVVLQIGMALIDKSQALIIDAADILDKGGRNGLFKAVKASGLPSLIAMTIDGKELVPNLAKAGIGVSYWLNGEAVAEAIA